MEIDKVCRLCGVCSEKLMHSIFSKNDNGQQLIQLIKQCLPILVYRTDPLSKEICDTCYEKLNEYSSFQKSTLQVHDVFKTNLLHRLHESPVKLYVDILDNSYQPENIQVTNYRSSRPFRNCASQIQVETRTNFTNTISDPHLEQTLSLANLTILTPSKINEKSETNVHVTELSEDCTVVKKRKLNGPRAGPRCKTRPHLKPIVKVYLRPLSLLQCALKQINRNLNLVEECSNSLDSFPTTEDTTDTVDTGSISQEYDEYSPSPDMSTMESSEFSVATQSLDTPAILPEFDFSIDVDMTKPAMCNLCEKIFQNLADLAAHEINHIKVDIGPRVGTKEFNMLHTKLAFYYNDYLRRQDLLPPKEVKQISKPVTRNVARAPNNKNTQRAVFRAIISKQIAKPTKSIPRIEIKPEIKPPIEIKKQLPKSQSKPVTRPVTRPKEKVSYEETEPTFEDENCLLVPHISNVNHEFKIENDEILVNGILLRSMDKADRKACYKDILIEGVKRKFCSLCRYSFKDNWSIENHYMSGVCLFTCKFCGRKFKYHKELFESHLRTHKGETPNKVFGPKDRQYKMKFKKKRLMKGSKPVYVGNLANTIPPKVKPIKIKQLMQKKMNLIKSPHVKIKAEPDLPPMNDAVTLEASTSNSHEPYQAYFCRKCFKVFFNVHEYNTHIRVCNGSSETQKNKRSPGRRPLISETRVSTPDSSSSGKRLTRTYVKEISGTHESDNDSQGTNLMPKRSPVNKPQQIINNIEKVPETGWECGICCSSFPSKYSRNSHMRIHKGQEKVVNRINLNRAVSKAQIPAKQDLQQTIAATFMQHSVAANFIPQAPPPQLPPPKQPQPAPPNDFRYANLNPTVARLVQNNPHLTIRSYTKSEKERQFHEAMQTSLQQPKVNDGFSENASPEHSIKRNYKCADCEEKFENKSILYYHKMNSCIVKRHYECAFCRKKFGTYDQYNTHMFYVHPE